MYYSTSALGNGMVPKAATAGEAEEAERLASHGTAGPAAARRAGAGKRPKKKIKKL